MREFIDGNTAIVRAALDSGCTFFAGYPITPASAILMAMMRERPAWVVSPSRGRTRSPRSGCASAPPWPGPGQ